MKRVFSLLIAVFLCALGTITAQRSVEILPDVDTLYICTDSTALLSATDAQSYTWSPAAIFSDASAQNTMATPTSNTLVILEAVVNGIVRRDSIVLIPSTPSLSLTTSSAEDVCVGEVVTLTANNNVLSNGLTWETPPDLVLIDSLSDRLIFQPTASAEFKAQIDLNGCIIRDSILVGVKPPMVNILNEDTVLLCKDSEVTLAVTTSTGLSEGLTWSPAEGISGTTGGEVIASPKETTTYYTTFIEGGCTIVDSVVVRIDSIPPDLSIEKDEDKEVYCNGDVVTLKSPTFNPDDYPIIEHIWSTIKVFPDPGENPIGTIGFETPDTLYNLVFTAQDSATYRRITRSGGCLDTADIDIPVIPPKDITITPDPAIICPGETIDLTAEFEGEGEITWMPEEVIQGPMDQKTVRIGPLSESTEVTIQVEEEGCPSTQSITVQTLPSLISLNTQTAICQGEDIQLNLANFPGVSYVWSSPGNPSFSTDPNLTVSPNETTDYTVEATFGECPPESADIRVNVITATNVTINPPQLTICPNEEFTLVADGDASSFGVEEFEWSFGGSTQNGASLTVRTLTENATFLMNYRVSSPAGTECFRDQASANITVEQQPDIEAFDIVPSTATSDGILLGDNVTVTAVIEGNTDGYTFQWMANDENIPGSEISVTHTPTENTRYKLTLISPNGCEVVATSPEIRVIVPQYSVPNVFTPNGDNVNDFFNIAFVGIRDITEFIQEFQVFNRWGQLVYNNETPETGWDGNFNGNPAPADVYVYKIIVRFPDGREEENTGEVTLIR